MWKKIAGALALVVAPVFVLTATASAATQTLGLSSPPSFGVAPPCAPGILQLQWASDPAIPYTVPVGGTITDWSTYATMGTGGAHLTFVVLNGSGADPTGNGFTAATVVAADPETLPSPLPLSGIATFQLTTPIPVTAGDTLGLYSGDPSGPNSPTCVRGGLANSQDEVQPFTESSTPVGGQTLSPVSTANADSAVNVFATFHPSEDAGVTITATPDTTTTGGLAVLLATVTNNGPAADPITFTDTIPADLAVTSTSAGCTTSGQQVTCTISGLAAGGSEPVAILVKPAAAGTYPDSASVAVPSGDTDANSANNTASTTLTVQRTPTASKCAIPGLRGVKRAFARQLVDLLGCVAGGVRHAHSKSVPKGDVIRTSPGAGTYAPGDMITFVVSSGPKKKRHK